MCIRPCRRLTYPLWGMFSALIERWVQLARLSSDLQVRNGHHVRSTEWPIYLLHAENDRTAFDNRLCWTVACRLMDEQDHAVAFAMATHPRLGAQSPAFQLFPDLMRHILLPQMTLTPSQAFRDFLHKHCVDAPAGEHRMVQNFSYAGIPIATQQSGVFQRNVRRLIQSEQDNDNAVSWKQRPAFFFCRRGWFAGVDMKHAPKNVFNGMVVTGVFESIPHIYCGIWFPICWPFETCKHLLHVTFQHPNSIQDME